MQLLKRLRLEQCHRGLQDPALATTPVKGVIATRLPPPRPVRPRLKQLFGVSASQVRALARQRPSGREG
jgi:hypothetical protein